MTELDTAMKMDTTQERAERIADSIRSQISDKEDSRRGFLAKSAVAGGALLALGGGTAVAQDEEEEEMDDEPEMAPFDDRGTDVDVLNYALTLENLEDAFYREALEEFDEEDFVESDALAEFDEETRYEVYDSVVVAGEHESTHVDVLTQVVQLLGGDPAMEMEYDFGFESVGDVLELAQVVENTGVAAYAGAAPYIESPDLVSAAVSIHSVEARHAAVFNRINGDSPFPDAFDAAMSQQEVLDAVGGFIVGPAEEDEGDEDDEDDEEEEPEDEEEEEETPEGEEPEDEEEEEETPEGEEPEDEEEEEEETETPEDDEDSDNGNGTEDGNGTDNGDD